MVASITDCVVEGLKYPINDIKKLLGFGVLFVVFDLLSMLFSLKAFDAFRAIIHTVESTNATASTLNYSMLPSGDIYMGIGALAVGFIVSLFILGYQYDVVKFSIDKKDDLPGFGDIAGMFVKGIKYFLVVLAYNVPAMIVMFLAMLLLGDISFMPIVMVISGLICIIAFFLMIMALNNMVAYDSLKKAFDFGEILDNISNLGWGKYIGIVIFTVIVFMIINMAVSFVLSFLTVIFAATINNQALVVSIFITIIGSLFVSSYCGVFLNRVCGSIYRESIK